MPNPTPRLPAAGRILAALLAALLATATAAGADGKTAAGDGTGPSAAIPDDCAIRYHSSLKRIEAGELPALALAAGGAPASAAPPAGAGDPSLPGTLIFVSQPRPRSPAEIAALTAAVALARSKGRSATVIGGDTAWIGRRLREDLADYLGQKPTPYLCNGVDGYVRTLRGLAAKLGPSRDNRQAWLATQRAAAEGSVAVAADAIGKAAASPAGPVAEAELRPAVDPARGEAPSPAGGGGVKLDDPAGLAAAVDRLVAQARTARLVTEPEAPAATGGIAAPAAGANAVLARLAAAKPYVMSARPLIRDRTVRLKMLAAFADLEMLDYLLEAKDQPADPVASGVGRTLQAIEKAHATDCTCGR